MYGVWLLWAAYARIGISFCALVAVSAFTIFFSLLSAIYRPKCESTAERERARALASIFLVCTLSDVNVHVIKPRKTAN